MNLSAIAKLVAELLPDAIGVRIADQGGGVYALHCLIAGMARTIQFSAAGIYGEHRYGMWAEVGKSDQHLATELAKAVRT